MVFKVIIVLLPLSLLLLVLLVLLLLTSDDPALPIGLQNDVHSRFVPTLPGFDRLQQNGLLQISQRSQEHRIV